MNKTLVIVGAAILSVGVIAGSSYFNAWNVGNTLENQVKAEYTNLKNVLAQYGNAIAETSQVPEMYRDDLIAVATAAMEGRYGENGAGAVFQMIQEQNPQVDSAVYVQIQRVIEVGRFNFQNNQTRFLDTKRVYETALGTPWRGTWMKIAGYPSIDLDAYEIVTSVRAEDAFTTKTEAPIKLR